MNFNGAYTNSFPQEESIRQVIKSEYKNLPNFEIYSGNNSTNESNKEMQKSLFDNKDRKLNEKLNENKAFLQIEKEVAIEEKDPINNDKHIGKIIYLLL